MLLGRHNLEQDLVREVRDETWNHLCEMDLPKSTCNPTPTSMEWLLPHLKCFGKVVGPYVLWCHLVVSAACRGSCSIRCVGWCPIVGETLNANSQQAQQLRSLPENAYCEPCWASRTGRRKVKWGRKSYQWCCLLLIRQRKKLCALSSDALERERCPCEQSEMSRR